MERILAHIEIIKNLSPIEGADFIELAEILGWQCVVKKGEFRLGDRCVYFEIDSVLPEKPEFEFLRKSKFKIKTIRLKKVLSQGLALPINILPENEYQIGQDVTEILGVKKYEPYIPAQLAGKIKGNFPSFLIKSDEERVQNLTNIFDYLKLVDNWYVSEKLDGSSLTCYLKDDVFGVCSRNLDLLEEAGNSFWSTARALDIEEKLRKVSETFGFDKNVAFQGELVGPGVQGNKYKLEKLDYYIFNVFNIDSRKFSEINEYDEFLNTMNLKTVPIIATNRSLEGKTIQDLIEEADGDSSLYKTMREGLVWRPMTEKFLPKLGRVSFKSISNKFLLKNED